MSPASDPVRRALLFFGRISASVSHEIKNCLAIINESAGLIEDLAAMAAKGRPLDPERVASVAGKVRAQVRRADAIVKNMNAFAHTVDQAEVRADLRDSLRLILALSSRFAERAGVELSAELPEAPVMVTGSPFALQHVLFACVERALAEAAESRKVVVRLTQLAPGSPGARVVFEGTVPGEAMPSERESLLAEAAGAVFSRGDDHAILLDLPDAGPGAAAREA